METTRHYTASVFVVNRGSVLLHDHKWLDQWLPPGGHVEQDELPHEAGLREVAEETGLDVTLVADADDVVSEEARSLPKPDHVLLTDVNVHPDGSVGHQHIDLIFYAEADSRDVVPEDGEVAAEDWKWFSRDELATSGERVTEDVVELGKRSIDAVGE